MGAFLTPCDATVCSAVPPRPPWRSCSPSRCCPPAGLVADGPAARAAAEIRPRITGIKPLSHEVYGYLPYWRLDSGTVDRLHYELVSSIAFFGLGIKSNGALDTDWVGYKEYVGDDAAAVTNAAHDRGVRVVPTFQLFDSADGYPKMTKFLTSTAAQDRFIAEALDLMAARKADGAGLDFEPVGALNPLGKYYVPFVQRFRDAMKARFPDATLVNALSAGGSERIIKGLVGVVDHEMVMTYNYRWSGSTITGAIAPLDHAARNVKIHIARILQWAPAKSILLGVPYYGYNWPVKSKVPERLGPHAAEDVRRGHQRHLRERPRLAQGAPEDQAAVRRPRRQLVLHVLVDEVQGLPAGVLR